MHVNMSSVKWRPLCPGVGLGRWVDRWWVKIGRVASYDFYHECHAWQLQIRYTRSPTEKHLWTHTIVTTWKHDDVIKWKHFTRYWPFERRINRAPGIQGNSHFFGQYMVSSLWDIWGTPVVLFQDWCLSHRHYMHWLVCCYCREIRVAYIYIYMFIYMCVCV